MPLDLPDLLEMEQGGARRALPAKPRRRDSGRRRRRDRARRAGHATSPASRRGSIQLVAWSGKVFDREKGDLKNKILPFGLKAVRAKVYKEASWFDGEETIVLDYSKTSFVARKVRDEIREVAPGLFLGLVFWEKDKVAPLLARVRQ